MKLSHSVILLLCGCVSLTWWSDTASHHACASLPPGKEELLQSLTAKDAQFDNLSVTFTRRRTITRNRVNDYIEAVSAGRPPEKPLDLEKDEIGDYDVDAVAHVVMTVKGSETTFEQKFVTDSTGTALLRPQIVKWGNASGVEQDVTDAASDAKVLHTYTRPLDPHGLLQEVRMMIEFCSGIGYGKRTVAIDSVESVGDRIVARCTMKLFSGDTTKAELEIDDKYLIRKAVLRTDSRGSVQVFEIATLGVVGEKSGSQLAEQGQLKRTAIKSPSAEINRVTERMSITIEKLSEGLPPNEYARLSHIATDGVTHRVEMTQEQPPRQSPSRDRTSLRRSNSHWMWIIGLNAMVVIVLTIVLFLRQKS